MQGKGRQNVITVGVHMKARKGASCHNSTIAAVDVTAVTFGYMSLT